MSSAPTGSARRVIRFGVFELDVRAGELRKNGSRVRLQEQPLQLLVILLERPGDVLTRDELRQKLWPGDTFVDFDHSLNTAVNKIREALGDSASTPRYVETVARRGYRFIAPVTSVEAGDIASEARSVPGPPSEMHDPATVKTLPTKESSRPSPSRLDADLPSAHRGVTRALFGLIQVMYLVFYLVSLFRLQHVDEIASSFLPGWGSSVIAAVVLITAGIGIPLRCYLLSAVAFDYCRVGEKFQRLFILILPLDQLWAISPFLLTQIIGLGAAFAATAALLYVPFSERTLVRMAYPAADSTTPER
jgi:DNA-binding winged helix-turn-helix (wHTH) protein